jgi:signal transduction histidine kinase
VTERQPHESKSSPSVVTRPIARDLSQRLAVLIVIITTLVSVSSYLYSMATAEEQVREQLLRYSGERGLRESALFLDSDEYQARFQAEYVERYKRMGDENPIEWFNAHLEKNPEDGTYRSKPELYYGVDRELGRRDVSASMMVGAETNITPEVRRALAIGYDMINQYGPAWRKPFVDLYFSSPEKTSVSRWPGTPWGLMMDDQVEWREEEWFAITTITQNPQREQRWSGVLYDERNGNWMVSGVTPLDIDGKQVGMVGTDLLLDDLMDRTITDTLAGTYNILIQADGRIIAHPDMTDEIIASAGQLSAQNAADDHLLRIYEQTLTATMFPSVLDNKKDSEFLAITQVEGPDWYLITVYPKSLMRGKALRNTAFILLSGFVSLVAVVFAIIWILERNLVNPLGHLTQTIRDFETGRGHWFDRVDVFIKKVDELSTRPDETGLLARSFVDMGGRLSATYSEQKKAEEIAVESQKMASIGRLAAGMAHEINSPLQLITGLSKRLTRQVDADDIHKAQFRIDLEKINKNGWRIANIIRSLLTYSRQTVYDIAEHQLNDIIADTLFLIEHQLKSWANITINKELAQDLPPICCDSNNITQVMINLLENAQAAMPEGGWITIRSGYDDSQKRFILQIHNTGKPIPPEIQSKIFEPFFTTKGVGKGTGLGLSIVHGIVTAHGGEIAVESEAGKGTTFSIHLPKEPPPADLETQPDATNSRY